MSEQASSGNTNNNNKPNNTDEVVPVPEKKEELFDSKLFRLFTVGLYLAGVSGLGMTISLYHLFFWDSSMPEIHITKAG